MAYETLAGLKQQADCRSNQPARVPKYEIHDPQFQQGPHIPPSQRRRYFDMEGFPLTQRVEYLSRHILEDGNRSCRLVATCRRRKLAVEAFIDCFTHAEAHPEMHVFHYASYEKPASQLTADTHAPTSLMISCA